MIVLDLSILNQKGTPMFNSDTLANRPAAGIVGRIFIATDSPYGIYRDTGSAWDQISGTSTFSGSLATGQVAFGSATNTISGTNNLFWNAANGRLGIGTNSPTEKLSILGNTTISGFLSVDYNSLYAIRLTNNTVIAGHGGGGGSELSLNISQAYLSGYGALQIRTLQTGLLTLATNNTNRIWVSGTTGNISVNTSVDNGNRFQVSGNATIAGKLTATSNTDNQLTLSDGSFTWDFRSAATQSNSDLVLRSNGSVIAVFYGSSNGGSFSLGSYTTLISKFRVTGITNTSAFYTIYAENSVSNHLFSVRNDGQTLIPTGSLGIKTTSPYSPATFSLDVNGGLLVKNTAGTTAQITLINADPSIGGNNGFLVASVGGTSGGSFVDLQGYYGTSITGSTALRLNPAGGAVIVNSTTNTGEQFQLTGTIRVNGQTSGSAGGNSGQHLIINCDGTSYKIALLNP